MRKDQIAVVHLKSKSYIFEISGGYEMKITYESATETIEIEVSEKWGHLIEEMNKEDARVDRKETRRHEGLNLVLDESPWLDGGEEDPGDALIRVEVGRDINIALSRLTERQREVFLAVHYYGYGITEYAKKKGVSQPAITKSLKAAEKKLKKFL